MGPTPASRSDIFRAIATTSYHDWPAYDSTPLYDRSSLSALEEDIRTVASAWFAHSAHNTVDEFIRSLPLKYVDFRAHNRYSGPATYEMEPLIRAFLLKEVHGWDPETALIKHLERRSAVRQQLGFETVPNQLTLWRTVDLLVQIALTGRYEKSPLVTAENTLTLLKKQTGIG